MSRALHLAEQLIARRSVTPDDAGCQQLIASWLEPLGFTCHFMPSGPSGAQVSNLWAVRRGTKGDRLLAFAGHGLYPDWLTKPHASEAASVVYQGGQH